MKPFFSIIGVFFAAVLASPVLALPVCPVTSNTNTDCGYIITIGLGGTVSGAAVLGAAPYDGSDDALVGIVNNSGAAYTGSITLTGSDIFGFDGDGICAYVSAAYCATARTGYEGPITTFTVTNGNVGSVNVTGLAAGASTYFSLEGAPNQLNIVVTSGAPEPATLAFVGLGFLAVLVKRSRYTRTL